VALLQCCPHRSLPIAEIPSATSLNTINGPKVIHQWWNAWQGRVHPIQPFHLSGGHTVRVWERILAHQIGPQGCIQAHPSPLHRLELNWGQMSRKILLPSCPYVWGQVSTLYFNLFTEALHWIIKRHIPTALCHYLDNFLPIFKSSISKKMLMQQWSGLRTWKKYWVCLQLAKTIRPTMCLEFLGLEL